MTRQRHTILRGRLDISQLDNSFRLLGWDPFAIFRRPNSLDDVRLLQEKDTPNYRVRRLFRDNLNVRVADLKQSKGHI